jgi:glycine cleavage system H protein
MNLPDHLRYTTSHEWVKLEDGAAFVGITDHAQAELGDIVYIELPERGRTCRAGESIAVIESVKAASDIYAPIAGEILAVNDQAASNPTLVNSDPYGAGWLVKFKPADPAALDSLLTADAYRSHIGQ